MDLRRVSRADPTASRQRERMGAKDLVGRGHLLAREVRGDQRRGRERARGIELEGPQQILELTLRLARVTAALGGAHVSLGAGAGRERIGRPRRDGTEQLEGERIDLVERRGLRERLLRAVRVARASMEHADAHEHRRRRDRVVVALDLPQLRGGEARLAEPLEPARQRVAQLRVVDRRERAERELDRRIDLRIARGEAFGEQAARRALLRVIAHDARELEPRAELCLLGDATRAALQGRARGRR